MDIERTDLTRWKNKPRIAHRVVVNNQTVSIFETFDYANVIGTIDLANLDITNHDKYNDCIVMINKLDKQQFTACTIDMYQGDHDKFI